MVGLNKMVMMRSVVNMMMVLLTKIVIDMAGEPCDVRPRGV